MISSSSRLDSQSSKFAPSSVLELIRRALPQSERGCRLRWNDRLADLGLSSLRLLSLIIDLEERFDLSADALARLSTRSTIGSVVQICLELDAANEDASTIH